MIVISGIYKGRKLNTLNGLMTRPTSSRMKEDMFNILNNYFIFENKISLDLFGGSGALSIEGLSRGIQKAFINDSNNEAIDVIKKNLEFVKQEFEITNLDWKHVLRKYFNFQKFDIIYLDPPFAKRDYYEDFFKLIHEYDSLNKYGVVSVQSDFDLNIDEIANLTLLKFKILNKNRYYLFRKEF